MSFCTGLSNFLSLHLLYVKRLLGLISSEGIFFSDPNDWGASSHWRILPTVPAAWTMAYKKVSPGEVASIGSEEAGLGLPLNSTTEG